MIINRRTFNVSSLALLLASATDASDATAAAPNAIAVKALNRLTFGATQKSVEDFSALGLEAWLDRELAKPASNDDLRKRLSGARLKIEYEAGKGDKGTSWKARKESIPYQYFDVSGERLLPLLDFEKHGMDYEERIRPAREVQAASLIRAVHADAQLREVMTQFWHDHFSVNSMRDEHTAAYFAIYDKMLRENAFENFRVLLGEVARSPSMLFYLNNEASRASPANENFARELFELHTLGAEHYLNSQTTQWSDVPGAAEGLARGYIDQDVYEAARALTGWSFGDGRWIADNDNAPMTGEFHYIDRWHDPYQKRILAVEFRANDGPMADGEKLFDVLAHHPGTALYVCRKICRRLVADEPPQSLIDQAVAAWQAHVDAPDQIAKVIRTIVLSPEFADTEARKLKRPFEFLASFYRSTDAEVTSPSMEFIWELSKAGWNQHEFRPPTGHPDKSDYWTNTNLISGYVSLALNAFEDWNEAGKADLAAALPKGTTKISDTIRFWVSQFHHVQPADGHVGDMMVQISENPDEALPTEAKEREQVLRGIVAMVALSPQFLFR
jgi:uncharacterized protein (DUF1800 family)